MGCRSPSVVSSNIDPPCPRDQNGGTLPHPLLLQHDLLKLNPPRISHQQYYYLAVLDPPFPAIPFTEGGGGGAAGVSTTTIAFCESVSA
jgi:hypothetical protein